MKRAIILAFLFFCLGIPGLIAGTQGKEIDFLLSGMTISPGNPAASGQVYSYQPGTTTAKPLYSDYLLTTPLPNPATLDSYGKLTAFGDGMYKIVVKTSDGITLLTVDGVDCSSAQGFLNGAIDPFGATFYQTNLLASYVYSDLIDADTISSTNGTFTALLATLSGDLDCATHTIKYLATPTVSTDAANKGYADYLLGTPGSRMQIFTSSPATFTVPANVTTVYLSMIGGGGGGGGYGDAGTRYGEAGGCGESVIASAVTTTPGASISITIGAGGAAGTNGGAGVAGTAGSAGGTTSFGSASVSGGKAGGFGDGTASSATTLGIAGTLPTATPFGTPGSYINGSNAYGYGVGGHGGIEVKTRGGSILTFLSAGKDGVVIVRW